MQPFRPPAGASPRRSSWPAAAVWALCWAALVGLDDRLDLANRALLLVLGAAVAALWSSPWASVAASAAAVLAFNLAFVPPRGAFSVDLHQHALLLLTMLTVSWIVTLLVARLRWHALQAEAHAQRSDQLRALGDALRADDDPLAQARSLQAMLARLSGAEASLLLDGPGDADLEGKVMPAMPGQTGRLVGSASADEQAGLQLCRQESRALGPGTGRHEEQSAWYLPLRGRTGAQGAALVRLPAGDERPHDADLLAQAQALCDQLGAALERGEASAKQRGFRDRVRANFLRM